MDPADVKKIKQQQLNEARIRTGAKKDKIVLTQAEWNAIQAGAISTNVLSSVISNSDVDTIKRLAMPKTTPKMTPTMRRRAQTMMDSGYSQADVADALGIGLTTLKVGLDE
jgi:phosphoenolpyruvate synthase/pyruvate phosphate dikinase